MNIDELVGPELSAAVAEVMGRYDHLKAHGWKRKPCTIGGKTDYYWAAPHTGDMVFENQWRPHDNANQAFAVWANMPEGAEYELTMNNKITRDEFCTWVCRAYLKAMQR